MLNINFAKCSTENRRKSKSFKWNVEFHMYNIICIYNIRRELITYNFQNTKGIIPEAQLICT